ncbi:MAG: sulfatase [Halobacteriales archaeon]
MPNVVMVHTDDTGRYIGPYGHDIDTPHLSSLADEGVLFRDAYCAGPTCSPSRAAVMTGQCPHSNGMLGLAHRGFSLEDYDRHLAGYLSRNGCESVLAGQQHEGEDAHEQLGYDRVLEGDEAVVEGRDLDGNDATPGDLVNAAAAAEFVRERGDDEDPFFLSVGLYNTHQPMPLDQETVDPDRVTVPDPLPDVEPVREEMAAYHVLAGYVDECVGTVVEGLEEGGHLDDTLVVFTTDHGIPFPYMKCDLRDGGMGVSLITRFPDGYRAGEAEDALVSTMDLFPTYCEFLDAPVPDWVEGPSLMPLVREGADSVREQVFSEVTYHAAYEPKRCVRTDRYKYIRRFDEEYTREVGPNTDDGPSKQFLVERGYLERERPREALYDLYHDPSERENLADDPAHADVREAMAGRLEAWMERTGDPLLEGPVPKPEGAVADRRDGVDPGGEYEPADAR